MTNPVTKNASQLPSPATPFFNPDGKTLSAPYRAFFRTLSFAAGTDGGGGDVTSLIKALQAAVSEIVGENNASVPIPLMGGVHGRLSDLESLQILPVSNSPLYAPEGPVANHGIQDEPDLHAIATQAASGFLSSSDKAKIDGITATLEDKFVAGTGFTPGTTTSLTLSKAYASPAAVLVHFDASFQGADQYSISGTTITFTSPIPVGITTVYARG